MEDAVIVYEVESKLEKHGGRFSVKCKLDRIEFALPETFRSAMVAEQAMKVELINLLKKAALESDTLIKTSIP
jgi:hypothetical protein